LLYLNEIPVVLKDIKEETPTIKRFTLEAMDHAKLPPFSGGSQ
jgi:ferredoxin-NADP reductase